MQEVVWREIVNRYLQEIRTLEKTPAIRASFVVSNLLFLVQAFHLPIVHFC